MRELIGRSLGSCRIVDKIGEGGMGEVYRARDERLNRDVAIKVLPEHLAKDPERRERFEREAKAVSSLNYPNICTLFDIGEHFLMIEGGEEEGGSRLHLVLNWFDELKRLAPPERESRGAPRECAPCGTF